jgi:tetratricopeptide (TPR) repeat protein
LAEAAQIIGRADQAISVLRRAFQAYAEAGEIGAAVRCGFWLVEALALRNELAQAGGWLGRLGRLVEQHPDCAERAYLLLAEADKAHFERDHEAESAALELGRLCGDRDVSLYATHAQGWSLVKRGRADEGLALLDETMVGIAAGEASPRITGKVYCSAIATCHELQELRRAREWTRALNAWVDDRPQFTGAYSGICRIHRSELLQLGGAWPDAAHEAELACELMTRGVGLFAAGEAFCRLGEIHRIRGDLAGADEAYRRGSEYGWDAQPGLSLLRLAQGRVEVAAAAIQRALAETADELTRSHLLPAYVDIMLTKPDVERAPTARGSWRRLPSASAPGRCMPAPRTPWVASTSPPADPRPPCRPCAARTSCGGISTRRTRRRGPASAWASRAGRCTTMTRPRWSSAARSMIPPGSLHRVAARCVTPMSATRQVVGCPPPGLRRAPEEVGEQLQLVVLVPRADLVHRAVHPRVQAKDLRAPGAQRPDEDRAAVGRVACALDPAGALEPIEDAGHGRWVEPRAARQRARAQRSLPGEDVEAVEVDVPDVEAGTDVVVEHGQLDDQLAQRIPDGRREPTPAPRRLRLLRCY